MALNYYKIKKYGLSLKYLRLAENIKQDKETRILNAFLYVKAKKYSSAEAKLKELLKENADDVEINIKLAEVYVKQNKKKESRMLMEKLIKLNRSAALDERVIKYQK